MFVFVCVFHCVVSEQVSKILHRPPHQFLFLIAFLFVTSHKSDPTERNPYTHTLTHVHTYTYTRSCEDKQTSADVSNVHSFQLPDPAGRAGGALTSALLHVTYADDEDTGKELSFKETLMEVRTKLQGKGFEQIPQLSSSRPSNLDEKFSLIPDNFSGKRRAVMIGINYIGDNPGEGNGVCFLCDFNGGVLMLVAGTIFACTGFIG